VALCGIAVMAAPRRFSIARFAPFIVPDSLAYGENPALRRRSPPNWF
jgi:hypothetical protein